MTQLLRHGKNGLAYTHLADGFSAYAVIRFRGNLAPDVVLTFAITRDGRRMECTRGAMLYTKRCITLPPKSLRKAAGR